MSRDHAYRCPACSKTLAAEDQDDPRKHRAGCRRFSTLSSGDIPPTAFDPRKAHKGLTMSDPDAFDGLDFSLGGLP